MNELINKHIIETGAYKDLDNPVLLTSGEIGIYYVNTEKLVQDGGEWEKHGDNSAKMIDHAIRLMYQKKSFKDVVEALADETKKLFSASRHKKTAVSGGQRRDWLFSGPVANVLNVEHIPLYKNEEVSDRSDLKDYYVVHIVDLITEGSSIYQVENGKERGWVPMLRARKATVDSLLSVVTRKQGGEERLKEQGVNVIAFVTIDENFVKKYSKYPERAVAYMKDPKKWSTEYLQKNGALGFIDYFDPSRTNIKRAHNFMNRYADTLRKYNKYDELVKEVEKKFGNHIG